MRDAGVVERSLAYLPRYAALHSAKLDTSHLTPQQVAERIISAQTDSFAF